MSVKIHLRAATVKLRLSAKNQHFTMIESAEEVGLKPGNIFDVRTFFIYFTKSFALLKHFI